MAVTQRPGENQPGSGDILATMVLKTGHRDHLANIWREKGLGPPRHLNLAITDYCNLKCLHCWPQCGPRGRAAGLDPSYLRETIEKFICMGVEELCLTGGEPLTHSAWLSILLFACAQPELKSISMQTNAALLGGAEAAQLAAVEHPGLNIQVSLDGATAGTHDFLRGKGSFAAATRGLRHLVDVGLGSRTTVVFTETERNLSEIPELIIHLKELGIGWFVSGTLVLAQRARHHALSLPTAQQYAGLLERYQGDADFRNSYEAMGNVAALEWFKGRDNPDASQCLSCQKLYIDGQGQLFPCTMLPLPRYALRDVYQRSARELVAEAADLWSELPELSRLRPQRIAQCLKCENTLHCAGGCLGRAQGPPGDFMRVEDRCVLRKAVYAWKQPETKDG
jgi:radical SAM protein with 4Fe4S-binding SPASM domain